MGGQGLRGPRSQSCGEVGESACSQGPGRTRTLHPREELPYSRAGLLVEQSSDYIKVNVRLVLTFTWNGEDSALVRCLPCPPAPAEGAPQMGWRLVGRACQSRRGWSCFSPTSSWSWTPSMPTRRVASVGTSMGCQLSMSSMPTVSVPQGQGGQAASRGLHSPREAARRGSARHWAGGTGGSWAWVGVPWQHPLHCPQSLCDPHTECVLSPDARLTPLQFGNLQKLDGPTEQCQDPPPSEAENCTDGVSASPGAQHACSLCSPGYGDRWRAGPWVSDEKWSPRPRQPRTRPPLSRWPSAPTLPPHCTYLSMRMTHV